MASRQGQRRASDSPRSAARFVRRCAPAIRARYAREGQPVPQPGSECLAIVRWAELAGKRIPSEYVEQYTYIGSGAEHQVYYDSASQSAIKATIGGRFGHSLYAYGRSALPLEYLSRLAWHNALFGDKIRIVGVCFDDEHHVEIVHSQPWIDQHEIRSAPLPEEIERYFADRQFERINEDPTPPWFYNRELNLVIADAHDANVIRDTQERIVAIDVVIGIPGPSVLAQIQTSPG